MKSKTGPASTRIKRLLEGFSSYSSNLYYMKGTDLTLSDFLSKMKLDKSNPHGIMPILFDLQEVLQEKYCVHTRSGAKSWELLSEKYMVMINIYYLI